MRSQSIVSARGAFNVRVLSVISPRRLMLVACVLLVLFTLIPPGMYRAYVREPNLMFGNGVLYLYLAACLSLIYAGISIGSRAGAPRERLIRGALQAPPFWYLLIPTLLALALVATTLVIIWRNDPGLFVAAFTGNGNEVKVKMATAAQGAMSGGLPLAIGISWWAYGRFLSMRAHMRRFQRVVCQTLIFVLIGFLSVALAALMSRYLLMPLLSGVFLLRLRYGLLNGENTRRLVVQITLFAMLILGIFGAIAILRNSGQRGAVFVTFIGYGPATLNHLAALLDGRMSIKLLQPYFDVMNFGFLYRFPFIERFCDLSSLYQRALDGPFDAAWRAGLNGNFMWLTSVGEIGFGLGGFAIPYLFIYGYIIGRAWVGFVSATTFGIIFYPWCAFCIIFTFGFNYFSGRNLTALAISWLLLWLYSGLVRPRLPREGSDYESSN